MDNNGDALKRYQINIIIRDRADSSDFSSEILYLQALNIIDVYKYILNTWYGQGIISDNKKARKIHKKNR